MHIAMIPFLSGLLAMFVLTGLSHANSVARVSPPLFLLDYGSYVHAQDYEQTSHACLTEKLPEQRFCVDGFASSSPPETSAGVVSRL